MVFLLKKEIIKKNRTLLSKYTLVICIEAVTVSRLMKVSNLIADLISKSLFQIL